MPALSRNTRKIEVDRLEWQSDAFVGSRLCCDCPLENNSRRFPFELYPANPPAMNATVFISWYTFEVNFPADFEYADESIFRTQRYYF